MGKEGLTVSSYSAYRWLDSTLVKRLKVEAITQSSLAARSSRQENTLVREMAPSLQMFDTDTGKCEFE